MIVGLTGGIATGKSTVAAYLRELGATVVDADQVSRDVVLPGSEGLAAIVQAFGDSILAEDGALDRASLRALVMNNANQRSRLEQITHPLIRVEIARRVQQAILGGAPAVFVEAALLVETGSAALYSDLWVVTCDPEIQRTRLMSRDECDSSTALAWMAAQMPLEEKARHATQIIENSGDTVALRSAVKAAYGALKAQQRDPD